MTVQANSDSAHIISTAHRSGQFLDDRYCLCTTAPVLEQRKTGVYFRIDISNNKQ